MRRLRKLVRSHSKLAEVSANTAAADHSTDGTSTVDSYDMLSDNAMQDESGTEVSFMEEETFERQEGKKNKQAIQLLKELFTKNSGFSCSGLQNWNAT